MRREAAVVDAFGKVWAELFRSPIHLDSVLSKQPKGLKTTLAQILPRILLRPASEAETLGVGVSPDEPWSLPAEKLRAWKPALQMAERIHASLAGGGSTAEAVEADFPPHMIREWRDCYGKDGVRALVQVLAMEPPLSLRASRALAKPGEPPSEAAKALLQALKRGRDLPVRAQVSSIAPLGVRLGGYVPVLDHPLFDEGGFEIQDEGSQLMALFALWPAVFSGLLSERPGPVSGSLDPKLELPKVKGSFRVVDACAGAGGKTLALADALRGGGRVYSYDVSAKKLQALRRRATRAGYTNIQALELPEGEEAGALEPHRESADVVLVDAPCTGWGVLRRNPDIKWRQAPESLTRLPEVQRRLLNLYASLVKPGGRLVYGVCTFRCVETREIVEQFVEEHPGFRPGPGGYLGPGPCDGFFMQAFEREA